MINEHYIFCNHQNLHIKNCKFCKKTYGIIKKLSRKEKLSKLNNK